MPEVLCLDVTVCSLVPALDVYKRQLYNIGVNIRMIGTSEIRVTVLVDEKDVDKAMRAAHDRFIED